MIILPSEISRLVLNYLEEEQCIKTYDTFLNECAYLFECKYYIENGMSLPKTIHGKTLKEHLAFNGSMAANQQLENRTVDKMTVGTQTDTIFTQTKFTWTDSEIEIQPQQKRKFEVQQQPTTFAQVANAANSENLPPIFSFNNSNSSTPKKQRLLIGKNTSKIPELSISTLERHLEYLTSNNIESNNINTDEQNESIQKQANVMTPENVDCNLQFDSNLVFSTDENLYQQIPYNSEEYMKFASVNANEKNFDEKEIDSNLNGNSMPGVLQNIDNKETGFDLTKLQVTKNQTATNVDFKNSSIFNTDKKSSLFLENILKQTEQQHVSNDVSNKKLTSPSTTSNNETHLRKIAPLTTIHVGQSTNKHPAISKPLSNILPSVINPNSNSCNNSVIISKNSGSFKIVPITYLKQNPDDNANDNPCSVNSSTKKRNYKPRKTIRRFIEQTNSADTSLAFQPTVACDIENFLANSINENSSSSNECRDNVQVKSTFLASALSAADNNDNVEHPISDDIFTIRNFQKPNNR